MSIPPGAWRNAAPRALPESAKRDGQQTATGFGPVNAVQNAEYGTERANFCTPAL
jgi:hypothetical protein